MRHKKALIVALIAAATLGLMVLDQTHITLDNGPPAQQSYTSATTAPDVTFALLGGGNIALQTLKGHTVWLHFWASWCVPCREEFSDLLKRIQNSDGNTILLAVSGDEKAENAERFLAPLKHDYQSLFDSGKVIIAHDPNHQFIEGVFQTFQYPETIIIGEDMMMQQKIVGVFKDVEATK